MHKTLGIILGISLLILISWFSLRLFQLTSQPGLKLKEDVYSVVNCEQPRDAHARMACPYLYCNKALLESGKFPANANISRNPDGLPGQAGTYIHGVIKYTTKENVPVKHDFQCRMQADTVIDYKILGID